MPTNYVQSVQKVRLKQVRDGRIRFAVDKVSRAEDVWRAVLPFYRGADREMLSVLCLDAANRPTCFSITSMGDLNTTRTHPREILKVAILSNALAVVLVHNHPSGSLEPSTEDREFTQSMRRACEILGIDLYDHVIVTDHGSCSLRELGLL